MKRVATENETVLAGALQRALAPPAHGAGVEQLVSELCRAEASSACSADAPPEAPGDPAATGSAPGDLLLHDTTERIEELFGLPTSLARLVAEEHMDADTALLLQRRLEKRSRARVDGASRVRLLVLSASLVMLTLVWLLG